jgi:cytochrome c biogenesis factor
MQGKPGSSKPWVLLPPFNANQKLSNPSFNPFNSTKMLNNIVKFFTSLKLTVTCLSLFMLIVFVGTIAQVDQGLYIVQERYFKSIFVYWGPANADWQVPIMPGGYLVGIFLMLNLVGAFIHRFKLTKKKVGIYISHAGLILLLLGQLFTDILSRESAMEIKEGETVSHSSDFRLNELALIDHTSSEEDKVYALSESFCKANQELSYQVALSPSKSK